MDWFHCCGHLCRCWEAAVPASSKGRCSPTGRETPPQSTVSASATRRPPWRSAGQKANGALAAPDATGFPCRSAPGTAGEPGPKAPYTAGGSGHNRPDAPRFPAGKARQLLPLCGGPQGLIRQVAAGVKQFHGERSFPAVPAKAVFPGSAACVWFSPACPMSWPPPPATEKATGRGAVGGKRQMPLTTMAPAGYAEAYPFCVKKERFKRALAHG